jgi:hypothetical protein
MEAYILQQTIERYKRLIAESERDPDRDEKRHTKLLRLLAEVEARHVLFHDDDE